MDPEIPKLKSGESVWCRLLRPEPGGYLVELNTFGIEGFLPSDDVMQIGRVVPATFVCMTGERALLTYAFILGTSARVQFSTETDEENAFSVWADSYPKSNRQRRAVDLVMPPQSPVVATVVELKLNTAESFFKSVEEAQFTGCVKVVCEQRLSRSAVLFHKGRAIGSIYTTKTILDPYSFDIGLKKMMEDLAQADAELEMYELPVSIVLSMSALFMGYKDNSEPELDKWQYVDKLLQYFSACHGTACLSLLDKSGVVLGLGFISNGSAAGAYVISERTYVEDNRFLKKLIADDKCARVQVWILPAAMTSDAMLFGYKLSSEQFASAD